MIYLQHQILRTKKKNLKQIRYTFPSQADYSYLDRGIKDQGQCGACWAFSAIGVTEMLYEPPRYQQKVFSEQDLIDCNPSAKGCSGQSSSQLDIGCSMHFIIENGFLDIDDKPYKGIKSAKCNMINKYRQYLPDDTEVFSYQNYNEHDCDYVKQMLYEFGPLMVQIATGQLEFYKSGIYSEQISAQLERDHSVILTGYTQDYWIIKNSWGKNWGENGYFKLAMGNTLNICWAPSSYKGSDKRIPLVKEVDQVLSIPTPEPPFYGTLESILEQYIQYDPRIYIVLDSESNMIKSYLFNQIQKDSIVKVYTVNSGSLYQLPNDQAQVIIDGNFNCQKSIDDGIKDAVAALDNRFRGACIYVFQGEHATNCNHLFEQIRQCGEEKIVTYFCIE